MRKRNHRIQFRLNDEELRLLNKKFTASKLSKDAFSRRCVLEKSVNANKNYPELLRTISKILNTYLHDLNRLESDAEKLNIGRMMVEKTWHALKEL